MALVVEDGSGKSNANSYISQADATTYFTNHDNPTAWSGLSSALKDAALLYATVTLDGMWDFTGTVTTSTQALAWPRDGVWDEEGRNLAANAIPQRIKDAECELALLHTSDPLNASYARSGAIEEERVGPILTRYFDRASMEAALPIIRRIILGLGSSRFGLQGNIERS
tara:strand:+ start:710 stop:1216 length:507 start_codon:yes stop_codon:yes gene_type:complete